MPARTCSPSARSYTKWPPVRCRFAGESSGVIFKAILDATPTPVVRLNPDLPGKLQDIIDKSLEKDRNLRYQHASEIRTDLQRLKRDSDSGRFGPIPIAISDSRSPSFSTHVESASSQSAHREGRGSGAPSQSGVTRSSSSSVVVDAAKQHKGAVIGAVALVLLLIAGASYGLYSLFAHRTATIPFQSFAVTPVTNSGRAQASAISPDGKYIVSVVDENGNQSLWLRNVPSGSNTQVLPPDSFALRSPLFSTDGSYIYYRKAVDATQSEFRVYRVPVLAVPRKWWRVTSWPRRFPRRKTNHLRSCERSGRRKSFVCFPPI